MVSVFVELGMLKHPLILGIKVFPGMGSCLVSFASGVAVSPERDVHPGRGCVRVSPGRCYLQFACRD